jgi:hypothetical protein
LQTKPKEQKGCYILLHMLCVHPTSIGAGAGNSAHLINPFFLWHLFRLVGLVSFGECGDPQHPVVYTRVREVAAWAESAMATTPLQTGDWGVWSAWSACDKLYVQR